MANINKQSKYIRTVTVLALILIVSIVVSSVLGRYPIGFGDIFSILSSKLFGTASDVTTTAESLLLMNRLPRIILGGLVGCSLSVAGASYQGVFQNPMAAPDILGASSGAAFGAALAILQGLPGAMIVVFAFASSLITVGLVMFVGNKVTGKRVIGLILSGIMISSLVSSGTSFIKLVADPEDQLPAITYWLMGSLNGTEPIDLLYAFLPMAVGLIPLFLLRWRMNVLTLGDDEAHTIGVNVGRLRSIIIICSTLITAAAVSVSGMIGWVGLVIPHLARRLSGSNFKHLLPTSALLGAIFMVVVDDVSRTLFATEIPIGILTSLIGAPFFIYLICRNKD